MPLLTNLSKLKSLSPAIIIGSAVIITIKLLTTQTPSQEEIITVSVKEDILNTEYEDKLDIPEPPQPESPAEEEVPPESDTKVEEEPEEEPEETTEDTAEDQADATDPEEKKQEAATPPPPPKPAPKLTWAPGALPNLLKKLVSSSQEK